MSGRSCPLHEFAWHRNVGIQGAGSLSKSSVLSFRVFWADSSSPILLQIRIGQDKVIHLLALSPHSSQLEPTVLVYCMAGRRNELICLPNSGYVKGLGMRDDKGGTKGGDGRWEMSCVGLENCLQTFLLKGEGHIHFVIPVFLEGQSVWSRETSLKAKFTGIKCFWLLIQRLIEKA